VLPSLCVQVTPDMKTKIDDRIKAVRDAVAKDSTEEIKAATEALQKEMMEIGSAMYQQAGGAAPGAAPGADPGAAGPGAAGSSSSSSSGKGGDDTIDAEFTDAK
jgi:hypothetical protein